MLKLQPHKRSRQSTFKPLCSALLLTSLTIYSSAQATNWGCTVTATPVNFGTYHVFNSEQTMSTGSVTVSCYPFSAPVAIQLDGGLYGNIAQRQMQNTTNADKLNYNLYTSASRYSPWGDLFNLNYDVRYGDSDDSPFIIYGRIMPGQDVSVGNYNDNVTVTVWY